MFSLVNEWWGVNLCREGAKERGRGYEPLSRSVSCIRPPCLPRRMPYNPRSSIPARPTPYQTTYPIVDNQ